ncbi:hypothetical protein J3A83DRAFT_4232549 [Scleroderma citrinum]
MRLPKMNQEERMLYCSASHPPRFKRPTSRRRISPLIAPSQPLGYGVDCRAFFVLVMVTQGGTSKPYKQGIARANVWPLNKKCSCKQGIVRANILFGYIPGLKESAHVSISRFWSIDLNPAVKHADYGNRSHFQRGWMCPHEGLSWFESVMSVPLVYCTLQREKKETLHEELR